MICAPRAAASRIFFRAISRFSSTVVEHFIWMSPTVNRSIMLEYYHFAARAFDSVFLRDEASELSRNCKNRAILSIDIASGRP